MNRSERAAAVAVVLAGLLAACGESTGTGTGAVSKTVAPKTISPTYAPAIDPADFSTVVDNPYFPLVPGTRTIFEGVTPEGLERDVVEVSRDTKVVMGVTTRVVHDVVSVDGKPEEETWDWYAQDRAGNVWYFGEDTRKLGGPTVDTSGSFQAGVDGAFPGIVMEARPIVGDRYRQEYAKGEAEDTGEVVDLDGSATLRGDTRKGLLVTEDVNPLDPAAAVEHKYYLRGVGVVLVEHVTGPPERVELIATQRF
jgi:hypothetical protein